MDSYEFLKTQKDTLLRKQSSGTVSALCTALETAINTVECASTDSNGEDLPWYRQAHTALRLAGRPWTSRHRCVFPAGPQPDTAGRIRRREMTPERWKELQAALDRPTGPTEAEAEEVLQHYGTSGREVTNEFIERLLRENLELKQRSATVAPDTAAAQARGVATDIASSCMAYAEMVESQNDMSEQVENWSDFHKGQAHAAKQLADSFRTAAREQGGEK